VVQAGVGEDQRGSECLKRIKASCGLNLFVDALD